MTLSIHSGLAVWLESVILYRPANTLTVITSKSTYSSVKEAHQDLEDNDTPYPNVYGFLETTVTGEEVSVKLFQDYS